MADNENGQRPVRKLTVKNFSVIKDAELEFGKITVLIGPQASGKSLLCKLAYFFDELAVDECLTAILEELPFTRFTDRIEQKFLSRFPIQSWGNEPAAIRFSCGKYEVEASLHRQPGSIRIKLEFCELLRALYSRLLAITSETQAKDASARRYLLEQVGTQIRLLLTGDHTDDTVYIPAGRSYLSSNNVELSALGSSEIDPVIRDFALEVRLSDPGKPDPIAGDQVCRSILEIQQEMNRIAGGQIVPDGSALRFRRDIDGQAVPLELLSSGTQELIPLFNVLSRMASRQRDRVVFPRKDNLPGMPDAIIPSRGRVILEEPEANVFPSTQNALVRLFVCLSNTSRLDFSWVITTHSPYILSSFNNLILAGQLGRDTQLKKKIKIDEKYWVAPNSLKAYSVHDGKVERILSKTGLINGEYLDKISENIGAEFDELLRLEYGKKKVS